MMTSSTALPGKLSRTSTQAMTVPITMLMHVTSTACWTVKVTAAQVCGLVSTS